MMLISNQEFFTKLKQNYKIRINYNKTFHDNCEKNGWWAEELWSYDKNTDTYRCYYPVSSYEKNFYTSHTRKHVEAFYEELKRAYDDDEICNISVEDAREEQIQDDLEK